MNIIIIIISVGSSRLSIIIIITIIIIIFIIISMYLYIYTHNLRPMVKDSKNPGLCEVLLPPWVVPLWSLDGPERFLLFQICAFTVFFAKELFYWSRCQWQ